MAALAGAGVVAAAWCLPAVAGAGQLQGPAGPGGAVRGNAPVYVQTNDITGNQVVTYVPSSYGGLRQIGRADTGGLGVKLGGAAVDDLASQGGLAYDPSDQLLVGVNGGSNTIFEFHTFGLSVGLPSVVSSGGTIPVSVAVRGNLVYVLNAGGSGAVQGFYANTLQPIPGGWRSLGLTAGASPQYLNTPGQIGFSPDGRQLIVTTKANGSDIDVLSVSAVGGLSAPTVNKSATPVPFGFTFDQWGHLVVTEAGTSAVTTYAVSPSGTTTELGSVTDGLTALCWIAGDGGQAVADRIDGHRCRSDRSGHHAGRFGPVRGNRRKRSHRHVRRVPDRSPHPHREGRPRAPRSHRAGRRRRWVTGVGSGLSVGGAGGAWGTGRPAGFRNNSQAVCNLGK
jgi:hypothetical protein